MSTVTIAPALVKCGKAAIVGSGPNGSHYVHRLFCGRWDCPKCGKRKAARLYSDLAAIEIGSALKLTYYGGWNAMNAELNNFRRRLKYRFPEMRYAALIKHDALSATGQAEVFLSVKDPGTLTLERAWLAEGCGKIEILASWTQQGEVVKYAAEFLKGMEPTEVHSRLMRSSPGFFDHPSPQSRVGDGDEIWTWRYDSRSPEQIADALAFHGYTISWESENAFLALPGPGTEWVNFV